MYDTDTGYRLYVFFHQSNAHIAGFPILINKNKMLSYKDFAGIQVGDSVKKVAEIDDVATMHKRQIDNRDFSDYTIDRYARDLIDGCKVYTLHYLTDGLLVIEYSDLNMVVSNISFYKDYVIPTADGQMTSHKIQDVDLP